MKTVDLKELAAKNGGEYVFGAADTGSHACYMIYGSMAPGEKGRLIRPGRGHEEIIIAVNGALVATGDLSGTLETGHAFHLAGEQTCCLENTGNQAVIYIVAGGHSEEAHSH